MGLLIKMLANHFPTVMKFIEIQNIESTVSRDTLQLNIRYFDSNFNEFDWPLAVGSDKFTEDEEDYYGEMCSQDFIHNHLCGMGAYSIDSTFTEFNPSEIDKLVIGEKYYYEV